jgi:hypothetical protein
LTDVVLLVLALGWGGVLFFWFRSRSQGEFADSVGLFHRHLHVLERAAPGTHAAANRLRGAAPATPARPVLRPLQGGTAGRDGAASWAAPTSMAGAATGSTGRPAGRGVGSPLVADARRRRTQRRRRDVLFVLAILVVATLLVAAVTGSTAALGAQLVADAVLGGYVALLIRIRNLTAERQFQVQALTRTQVRAPQARAPQARAPHVGAAPRARPRPRVEPRAGRRPLAAGYALAGSGWSPSYDLALRRAVGD